jgi:hypothetical protein
MTWELALFLGIQALGVVIVIQWWRESKLPIPARPNPHLIFRVVHRADRAAYVRIMRGTYAVALRDLGRAVDQAKYQIGKALLPSMEKLADELARLLR